MLDIKAKLALQRQASDLKKQIKGTGDVRQRLPLQRELSGIIKALKGLTPAPTVAGQEEQAAEDAPETYGRSSFLMSPKGGQVKTVFKLMEASRLIASNDADGTINPDYPSELQPRDRSRKTSVMQISRIANDLQPEKLTDSGLTSHGAPIVGPDRVVESGNGRTIAIISAYKQGKADNYRQFIVNNAETYGFTPEYVNRFKQPVLVRLRKTEVDRAQFARDSNASDLQSMSAAETAWSDAEAVDQRMMALFRPSDNGSLTAAENKSFIDAYIRSIGDAGAAGLFTADGRPTRQLVDRMQNAIFAKAYRSEKLVSLVAEETDPEIRNILSALNYAAGDFVEMQYMSGEAHKQVSDSLADATDSYVKTSGDKESIATEALRSLVEATELIRQAKATGQSLDEMLAQTSLFGDDNPSSNALAKFISANNRSSKRLSFAFKKLAENINAELQHQGSAMGDLFGDGGASLIDIMLRVNGDLRAEYGDDVNQIQVEPEAPKSEAAQGIDAAANEAATGANDLPEPTDAQKEAGNYKKGRLEFAGIDIVIENPKGSVRSGTAPDGQRWSTTMRHHYGDIKGSRGADGDPVDVFLGDVLEPDVVYVIDQINPETGLFDEHKVMLGFGSAKDAKKAYFANYEKGWGGLGALKGYTLEGFKSWVYSGQKTEPVKYGESSFPIRDYSETELPAIDVTKYQELPAIELKQQVLALSQQGYVVPELVPVMDHWLMINVADGQYIREQLAS